MHPVLRKFLDSPTLTTLAGQIVIPLRFLLLTPLVLSRFSPLEIDVFYIFASTTVFFQVIQNRVTDVFRKMLSYAFGGATSLAKFADREDRERLDGPNWPLFERAYLAMGPMLLIGALPAFLLSGIATWWSVGKLNQFDYSDHWLWGAVALSVIGPVFDLYFSRQATALVAVGRIARQNTVALKINLITMALSCVALLMGANLLGLMAIQFLMSWVLRTALVKNLPDHIRRYTFGNQWDREIYDWGKEPFIKGIIAVSTGLVAQRSVAVFLASTGVVGFAAPFLISQNLLFTLQRGSQGILASQLPDYSRTLAAGGAMEVGRRALQRCYFLFFARLVGVLGIIFGFPLFLELTGSKVELLPLPMLLVLCFSRLLYDLQLSFSMVAQLTNHIFVTRPMTLGALFSVTLFALGYYSENYWPFVIGFSLPSVLFLGRLPFVRFGQVTGMTLIEARYAIINLLSFKSEVNRKR